MVDVLTRAVRARQAVARQETAVVAATGTVNTDKAQSCARALVPTQRSVGTLRPKSTAADAVWTEIARETETVRVSSADGAFWVDVERVRRLSLRSETGARLTLILTP